MQTSTLPVEVAAPATPATPAEAPRGAGRAGESPGFAAALDRAAARLPEPEGKGPDGGLPDAAVEAVAGTPAAAVLAAIGRFTEPLAVAEVAVAVAGEGAAVGLVGDPASVTAPAPTTAGSELAVGGTTAQAATPPASVAVGDAALAVPAPTDLATTAAPAPDASATGPAVATDTATATDPVPIIDVTDLGEGAGASTSGPDGSIPSVDPGAGDVTEPNVATTPDATAAADDLAAGATGIESAPSPVDLAAGAGEESVGTPAEATPLAATTVPAGPTLPSTGLAPASPGPGAAATTELVARPADIPEALLDTVRRLERDGADGWRLQIRLDPPELGRVHLDLVIRGNQLHVTLNADTAGGASALAGQRESIERMLAAQGFELGSFDVASGRRDRSGGDRPGDLDPRGRRGDAPGPGGPIRGLGPMAGARLADTPTGPTGSRVVHL